MNQYPSIFNDVIGPVMIGPSSSHTAASQRIGAFIRGLAGGMPRCLRMAADAAGSLAATYHAQMSDRALLAGLLGYSAHDPALLNAFDLAKAAGLDYAFSVEERGPGHPNTYYLDIRDQAGRDFSLVALSVGGGMFQITEYQGFPVEIDGGFHESLLLCQADEVSAWQRRIAAALPIPYCLEVRRREGQALLQVETETQPNWGEWAKSFRQAAPVLPVGSQLQPKVPFLLAEEMLAYNQAKNLSLSQLALAYESSRSGLETEQVLARMLELAALLRASLDAPPQDGPAPRILPNQADLLKGPALLGGEFCRSLLYHVTRFMDIKTSLGVIVAAPTAGACACLPGLAFALAEQLGLGDEGVARALLAGGLVGLVIARLSTFAAEVCGCQAECGSGSGMAAAAAAELMGLPLEQGLAAASMALQNIFGLVCDLVGRKVEVPCLGKNVMGAMNAVASANMAAAGFDQVIPLDETVAALYDVGCALPGSLRCTGLGGLAVTPSALAIEARLSALEKDLA